MAAGDFVFFEDFGRDEFAGNHSVPGDVLHMAFITNLVTPAAADANPRFGVGSGVDYKGAEVNWVGNYAPDGITMLSVTVTKVGAGYRLDFADFQVDANPASTDLGRWGILFNITQVNNMALGFLDLGADITVTAVPLLIQAPNGVGDKLAA